MQFWTPALRAEAKSQKKLDDERWARKQKRLLSDDIGLKVMALLQENSDNPTCCRTCLTCRKVCRTTKDWLRHEGNEECKKRQCENEGREYVHPPPPRCEYCDKVYKNEFCLKKHLTTAAHKNVMRCLLHGPEIYRCEKCDKTFANKRGLAKHLKSKKHLAPKFDLSCDICDKTFKNKKTKLQHLRNAGHLQRERKFRTLLDGVSKTSLEVPKTALDTKNKDVLGTSKDVLDTQPKRVQKRHLHQKCAIR